MEMWIREMNSNLHSLQAFYDEGRYRRMTYKETVNSMMTEVRAVKKVSAHFTITPVYLHYRLTA